MDPHHFNGNEVELVPCKTKGKIVQKIKITILPLILKGTSFSLFQLKWRGFVSRVERLDGSWLVVDRGQGD
jgi:hypothetical protein